MKPRPSSARLITALADPAIVGTFGGAEWSALVATARSANLLGALAERLAETEIIASAEAARHLDGARQLSRRQRQSVFWEVHQLQLALAKLRIPVLLLKGAAYVMSQDHVARGRLFGDIDILVPHSSLSDVESQLMLNGWASAKNNEYDQRYYRQWMHEIPPMTHIRRGTVIDVHHTILPLTARNSPDPAQIISRSTQVAIPGLDAIRVPCPEDLVIHSITHLVHEGELHNGLRDLRDIDCMLRHFGATPGFWDRFAQCATGNDLAGPVCFGLQLVGHFFHTPVPDAVMVELIAAKDSWRSPGWLRNAYVLALRPDFDDGLNLATDLAKLLIYVRSHSLRMPWPMLARHLAIKTWKNWRASFAEPAKQ